MRRIILSILLLVGLNSEVWGDWYKSYKSSDSAYAHQYVNSCEANADPCDKTYDNAVSFCDSFTDRFGNSNYYLLKITTADQDTADALDYMSWIYGYRTSSTSFYTGSSYQNFETGQYDPRLNPNTTRVLRWGSSGYWTTVEESDTDENGWGFVCESDYATPQTAPSLKTANITFPNSRSVQITPSSDYVETMKDYYISGYECSIARVDGTSCSPTNLSPNTKYAFTMRTVGKYGKSDWSYSSLTYFTTPAMPLPNMNSVTWSLQSYNNSSNNYFRVSATSSSEDYKYFTKFDVQYRAVGTSSWIDVTETSNSYMDISPTSKAPQFEVQIKGYNDTGWGNWSSSKYIYSVVDGDDVTWSAVPDKRSASVIIDNTNGYNITSRDYQYKESSSSSWIGVDTNNATLILEDLRVNVDYDVQVKFYNGETWGDWSSSKTFKLKYIDGNDINWSIVNKTKTSFEIEILPENNIYDIDEPKYETSTDSNFSNIISTLYNPKGLDGTQLHYVRVANGEGNWSNPKEVILLEVPPLNTLKATLYTETENNIFFAGQLYYLKLNENEIPKVDINGTLQIVDFYNGGLLYSKDYNGSYEVVSPDGNSSTAIKYPVNGYFKISNETNQTYSQFIVEYVVFDRDGKSDEVTKSYSIPVAILPDTSVEYGEDSQYRYGKSISEDMLFCKDVGMDFMGCGFFNLIDTSIDSDEDNISDYEELYLGMDLNSTGGGGE